jgi:mRNA interferase MazF
MKIRRGDVVLVYFPDTTLATGKKRPALAIEADDLGTGFSQTVFALITSRITRGGHKSRVVISINTALGQKSGLKTDSVILTDNLATVHHSLVDRVIGSWGDMPSVERALQHTLGL